MKIILIIAGVIAALLLCENIRELYTFRTVRYQVKVPGLSPAQTKRAVFLSDLHNRTYGAKNARLLAKIRETEPDMVFVGGDMLIGAKDAPYTVAEKLVTALAEDYPVYYANGNHEQRMKEDPVRYGTGYQTYKQKLESAGVVFLENASVHLRWGQAEICISGLEIPHSYYKKFKRAKVKREEIEERLGQADSSRYQILLAHNPIHMETYKEWGANLVLSGHLHGGMIRLPGIGGLITPQVSLFPKYSGGFYEDGKTTSIVSKGIGNHSINIRLFNPAEVIVIEFVPEM